MRNLIDIMENHDRNAIPAKAIQIFHDWQEGYDKDGAWDGSRHSWQEQLIKLMRGHTTVFNGYLYRGSVVGDAAAQMVVEGQSLYISKSESLLEAWSKSPNIAGSFAAEHDSDNLSLAVYRQKASSLSIVLDSDYIDQSRSQGHEREVLVKVRDMVIAPSDIIALACCRYDAGEDTTYHIAPNLTNEVSFDEWHAFMHLREHPYA